MRPADERRPYRILFLDQFMDELASVVIDADIKREVAGERMGGAAEAGT